LWKHSKTVAALAHELAVECSYNPEVAYAAGLLHDIGRLAIGQAGAEVRAEEERLLDSGFPLTYAETLLYGSDHAVLGGDLLEIWNLPPEIVEAVRFHHRPEQTESMLAGILYMAEEEAVDDAHELENLSPGMRRHSAAQLTGIRDLPADVALRQSPIFALAG
jgi:putative nucleotidyltransferase with HDIG domain